MTVLHYRRANPADLRDLGEAMAAWLTSGNPKASEWEEAPERPDPAATWAAGVWVLPPPPPPPAPDFRGFYDSLLVSSCYSAALTQVMTASSPAPAAALAVLISAIQDALNGRPNPPALQASIWLLLGQISLGAEHLAELQGLLTAAHLDGLLSLEPPPGP